MKTKYIVLAAMSLLVLAGCASDPKNAYSSVLPGMSRNNLRFYCGEPLRIEPTASGGEDWYYRFSSWQTQQTETETTTQEFGNRTHDVSSNLNISKQVLECPVHISSDGFVVEPIPKGKVVKD